MIAALTSARTGWIVFYGLIGLSWLYVILSHGTPVSAGDCAGLAHCHGAHEVPPFTLFLMWVAMSAAMMLPTFHASLKVYADLRDTGAATAGSLMALQAGFLSVWLLFALVGAILQMRLAAIGLVDGAGASLSGWLTVALLTGAGLYQFSRLKDACLSKCRHPLTFYLERWRPGATAAYRMGGELGVYCMGCCWALMALGFIGGTMNLAWMGLATLFMIFEKLPAVGRHLTAPAGALCLVLAAIVAAQSLI